MFFYIVTKDIIHRFEINADEIKNMFKKNI